MLYMAVDADTLAEVEAGTTVTDFRGAPWTFVRIADNPTPGKSGKVEVCDPMGDGRRWFYPQVVNLRLVADLRKPVDVLHDDPTQDHYVPFHHI